MSGRLLKIISNILFVILSIVLLIAIYSFISLRVLNEPYVNFFSYTFFQVGSNSMSPSITTNDLLIVKITDDVKENDIITFTSDDMIVTHRLVEVLNDNSYLTKGDANTDYDQPITTDNIIGKVIKVVPNVGVWFKVFTSPKIVVLIMITLFLFSLAFSYKGKKKLKDSDDFGIYYSGIALGKGDKSDR